MRVRIVLATGYSHESFSVYLGPLFFLQKPTVNAPMRMDFNGFYSFLTRKEGKKNPGRSREMLLDWLEKKYGLKRKTENRTELEGARESAYIRQQNFYRRPLLAKFLRGHVWSVPGNMHV